jgi:hypothetical protein
MDIVFTAEPNNLAVIRASGILTRAKSDAIKRQVIDFIIKNGCSKIKILIIIEEDFSNLEAFANWEDDHDDEFIQQHILRMAIVGHLKWRDSALMFFLAGLLPFTIEFFKTEQEVFARSWLTISD